MKKKHLLLGLGLLFSLVLAVFGDKTPSGAISEPTASTRAPAPRANPASAPHEAAVQPVGLLVKDRQQLIASGDKPSAGLFEPHSWAPPPPKPVPTAIVLPPPPMAPPLPFTYFGKQNVAGEWMVFLKRENTTFVVKLLDVVETLYRIDGIAPPSMTFTYLPLNQQQTLRIE